MTPQAVTEVQAIESLLRGLAAASDDPTADLVATGEANPLLVGLGLAREVSRRETFGPIFDRLWDLLEGGQALQPLRVEHCRLFQGPPSPVVSPYEGSHLPGSDPGGPARAVARLYRRAGLSVSGDVRDRPDHVATEIEFLAALCRAECGEGIGPHPLSPADARRLHRTFLGDHASRWILRYARDVEAGTRAEYYRIYARALAESIRWDLRWISVEEPSAGPGREGDG